MLLRNSKLVYVCLLSVVLLVGYCGAVFAEEGNSLTAENQGNSLILGIKPFFTMEYEHRLAGGLDIVANYSYFPNVFSSDDDEFTMCSLGLSYYPSGSAMQGLYLGVEANRFKCTGDFLGMKFSSDSFVDGYAVSLGYKKIFNSGFAFDLGVKGVFYDEDSGAFPYVAFGLGW